MKSIPCKIGEGFADNVETRSARSSLGATGAKAGGQIQGMVVKLKNKMNKVSHCLLALLLIYRRYHLEYHKEAWVLHEDVPVEVFCPALIQPGKPRSHHLCVII